MNISHIVLIHGARLNSEREEGSLGSVSFVHSLVAGHDPHQAQHGFKVRPH